jgi:hypothetical protein
VIVSDATAGAEAVIICRQRQGYVPRREGRGCDNNDSCLSNTSIDCNFGMATARHLAVPQDENDMLHMHKVTFQPSGSGFSAHAGKGLSSRAPSGNVAKTPGKGLSSGRQALGNITNTAGVQLVHLNVSAARRLARHRQM